MMNIGIIGIGFMGTTHFNAAKALHGARVSAISSRDRAKLSGDWSQISGNLGRQGGVQDLTGIRTYTDYRDLISDPEVDLVDICLPVELHRPVAIEALRAGKHVIVEKPIAPTVADADAMIQAAEEAGRRLFVAHVVRFFPEFAYVKKVLDSGEYGKLSAAHLKRVISKPQWAIEGVSSLGSRRGGCRLGSPYPQRRLRPVPVGDARPRLRLERCRRWITTSTCNAQYLFDELGTSIACQSGALSMQAVPFEQGFDVYFEKATLSFNSRSAQGLFLWRLHEEEIVGPSLSDVDPFTAELQYVIDALQGKNDGSLLDARSARNSLLLCDLCRESARLGEPVSVPK